MSSKSPAKEGSPPHESGLQCAEEKIFRRVFKPRDALLEIDCGEGRIAFSFWKLGYKKILGVDPSRAKIAAARRHNRLQHYGVCFRTDDKTDLALDDALFEGVVWDANSLTGMPDPLQRRLAFAEIHRVLTPGAWFVFITPLLPATEHLQSSGNPSVDVKKTLRCEAQTAGFRVEVDVLSSVITPASNMLQKPSEESHFWVFQKPVQRVVAGV